MPTIHAILVSLACLAPAALCPAQDAPKTAPPAQAEPPKPDTAVADLTREAAAVSKLVETDLARAFLATAEQLPSIEPRTLYRDPKTRKAFTEAQAAALPEAERAALKKRAYDTRFYYTTGYGSPTIYARPLDILARNGLPALNGRKVLDFGYGMIGQERMMALLGADVHGVDVEPLFALLYSQPGDTGEMTAKDGTRGHLTLHDGQWPADPALAQAIGGGYDAMISKNTLKAGYIHPARETDPSRLVHLGVSDEEFLKAAYAALKPGGLFLVYNLSPRQAPPDKPYIPWADGKFPFERPLVESAGFEVLEWDRTDDAAARAIFAALEPGKTPESFADDLFAWYTLLRRPAGK